MELAQCETLKGVSKNIDYSDVKGYNNNVEFFVERSIYVCAGERLWQKQFFWGATGMPALDTLGVAFLPEVFRVVFLLDNTIICSEKGGAEQLWKR